MNANKNILVAIDDSEASDRAIDYVAQIVGGGRGFYILLLHVPAPMPPQLLEHGGAENPAQAQRAQAELRTAQGELLDEMATMVESIFARAQARLHEAHIPEESIKTELFMPPAEQSLDRSILQAAHAHDCHTVVVGREAFSWLRELFQGHVADKLMQQAEGRTLWIVQ
jgi:nucleotide-binding universal stress UspA family protein